MVRKSHIGEKANELSQFLPEVVGYTALDSFLGQEVGVLVSDHLCVYFCCCLWILFFCLFVLFLFSRQGFAV